MPYQPSTPENTERLLWLVYDEMHAFVQEATEHTIPLDRRINQLMLGVADLALALAGGFREGGLRQ